MARPSRPSPFTPADLRKMVFVSDPMVHPAGDRIAYVVRRVDPDRTKNRYRAEIRQTDPKGKLHRTLTAEGMDSDSPLWSPDGRSLLFLSKRGDDEKKQLYLLPADGGEARRLTQMKGGVEAPLWSPDGRWVAFLSPLDPRKKAKSGVHDARFAEDVEVVDRAFWRLNGLGNRLDKRSHLFVMRAAGGKPSQVTDGPWSVGGPYPGHPSCAFSADGSSIYYLATPEPDDDWAASRRVDGFVVGLDGKGARRITDFPGMFVSVRLSPSGELIAIGNDLAHGTASPNRLYRIDPARGAVKLISPDLDLSFGDAVGCDVRFASRDHDPWISPDGTRVRARVTERAAVRLVEVDVVSGAHTWLSPSDLSVLGWHATADGSLRAEIRTSMTALPELWLVEGGAAARPLTRLNERLLAERKLFPGRPVDFKASDGASVDAWVLLPPGKPKGGRAMVLAIHGGPKTVYGHAFVIEFQMLAAAGIAVLLSNPRGSDGYGTAWAEAVHAHYGERDYQDLMECVDHALSLDLGIDPRRLGVSGGSYGGFMTNWIIGHTDRFKAAVSSRGISNWLSMFGTSDIGYYFDPEHMGGLPWTHPETYREKSPITYAEAIRTPLLITHGEQDLRCPIEQAEQLFIVLKRLGRDVKLARFPEETHELSRSGSPNRRMERLRLIREWFVERL